MGLPRHFFPLDLREEERVLDMVLDWFGCIAREPKDPVIPAFSMIEQGRYLVHKIRRTMLDSHCKLELAMSLEFVGGLVKQPELVAEPSVCRMHGWG